MTHRLNNIFGKKEGSGRQAKKPSPEAPRDDQLTRGTTKTLSVYPKQLVAGTGQSVGLHREHNEDALFAFTYGSADGKNQKEIGFFIIADGMGGHRNGEVASSVACQVISRNILHKLVEIVSFDEFDLTEMDWSGHLQQAFEEAQRAVTQQVPGGGTTATAVLWSDHKLTVAHVGDSRAYLVFSDGRLKKLTVDHSLVQRLVEMNEITPGEADVHPQKNVLLRAIGQPEPLQTDVSTLTTPPGVKLMLCSDGLWGVVDEATIVSIVLQNDDPVDACAHLVAAANAQGGPDNISTIIAELKE